MEPRISANEREFFWRVSVSLARENRKRKFQIRPDGLALSIIRYPLSVFRSRGAVALFKRVFFANAAPSGVAAWGYFCSAFHVGTRWGAKAFLPSFPRRRRGRLRSQMRSRTLQLTPRRAFALSTINYPFFVPADANAQRAFSAEIRGRFFPPARSELRRTGDDEKLLRRSPFSSASRPLPDALTVCGGGFLVSCESSFPEASAPFEDKTPSKERTPFSP